MNAEKLLDAYCKKHQLWKSWDEQKKKKNFNSYNNHFSYFDMEVLASLAVREYEKQMLALKYEDFVKEIDLIAKRKRIQDAV